MTAVAVTIKDIARKTGLSLATISKYLNNKNVREENRIAIAAAIEELGYRPNANARSLKAKSTRAIGIIVPYIESMFFSALVEHTEAILRRQGYAPVIFASRFDSDLEEIILSSILDRNYAAVILFPVRNDSRIYTNINRSVPLLLVEQSFDDASLSRIQLNYESDYMRLLGMLVKAGHKSLGIVGSSTGTTSAGARLDFIRSRANSIGLTVRDEHFCDGDFTILSGYRNALRILRSEQPPTALICTSEETTFGAYNALNELGLRIPEDISLIGTDIKGELNQISRVPITGINFPMELYASSCVRLLDNMLSSKDEPGTTVYTTRIPTKILSGESICAPRQQ